MSPASKESPAADPVVRRLDAIIALLIKATSQPSITEQIRILDGLGLEAGEIGKILGKPGNYVGAVLGRKPKRAKSTKRR
jgi:hypothetical protein